MSAMRKYDVWIGDRFVTTVYFGEAPAKDVRHALIAHDLWTPKISVYRYAVGRHAYDDVARVSKPEEL